MKYRILIRDTDIGNAGSVAEGTWQNKNQAVKALIPKFNRAKVTVDYIICDDHEIDNAIGAYILVGDIGQLDLSRIIAVCPRIDKSTGAVTTKHVSNAYMTEQTYEIDLQRFASSSIIMRLVNYNLSALADNIVSWSVLISIEPYNDDNNL